MRIHTPAQLRAAVLSHVPQEPASQPDPMWGREARARKESLHPGLTEEARLAFMLLRHLQSDAVRDLRLAFDNGCTAAKLKRMRGIKENTKLAIDYMDEHPEAGRIRWTEGTQYTWTETEIK